MAIVNKFVHTARLIAWLEQMNLECGSPEAFDEWLQDYFEEGNEVEVYGEKYDYWACRELV